VKKLLTMIAAASVTAAFAGPVAAQSAHSPDGNLSFAVTAVRGTPSNKLIGEPIYDRSGQSVGSIVGVMAKDQTSEPTAIVSVADNASVGTKLVAVPFSHVQFDSKKPSAEITPRGSGNELNWLQGGGG
jgi:hypothetical protein